MLFSFRKFKGSLHAAELKRGGTFAALKEYCKTMSKDTTIQEYTEHL